MPLAQERMCPRAGGRGILIGMLQMDWDISKTSLVCAACNKEFAEEQEIFSALYDEQQGFVRRDYCIGCHPSQDQAAVFSFWHTRIPPHDAPVRRFVDDEVIHDLFRRLEGHDDPGKRNFRYVLALLLMRKKVLKFREFRRDEKGDVLLLQDRLTDAVHTVVDPDLSEEQIEQVTEEIGQVLNFQVKMQSAEREMRNVQPSVTGEHA